MSQEIEKREGHAPSVRQKRSFTAEDRKQTATLIFDEQKRREREREDREKIWKEVDRQNAMIPRVQHKLTNGRPDARKAWMAEIELPLQAQTLEVLTSDARRFMKPDSGPWFAAHAAMTDDYLENANKSLILGDNSEAPSNLTQDNIDKLVSGWHEHNHRQYDFWGNVDYLHAEAFKYGVMVARGRNVKKSVFYDTARGIVKRDQMIPMLVPESIWRTYLDDSKHALNREGIDIGPSIHSVKTQRFEDIAIAAQRGGKDPDKENGGWITAGLRNLKKDKNGNVKIIEADGDIIVPRKSTRSFTLPNTIATVAYGEGPPELIRLRFRKQSMSSFIYQLYNPEDLSTAYGPSPLTKGMPLAMAAADALARLMDWAALNTQPPVKYSPDDPQYRRDGGPLLHPGAQIPSIGDVEALQIGEGGALLQVYINLLGQYFDFTGTQAPRLGAETKSHTTAFSKSAELQRGLVRTLDFSKSEMTGFFPRWLQMEYDLGSQFNGKKILFLEEYGGYVEIERNDLPEFSTYEVFGAGGPSEEQERTALQIQAIQFATQIETLKVQLGQTQEPIDLTAMQKQALKKVFADVEGFFVRRDAGGAGQSTDGGLVQPALTSSSDSPLALLEGGG